jgi:cell division protein FtsQ
LVSQQGVIFTPSPQSIPAGLTYLQGPNGSVQQVIKHYRWLQQQLAQHKLSIARLILSDRHAWYVDLTNGLRLSLGTKDIEGRIKRFLSYLPQLPQPEALAQIDLRYINGFAAKWQELTEP